VGFEFDIRGGWKVGLVVLILWGKDIQEMMETSGESLLLITMGFCFVDALH
jgi:hypothetical protein